MQWHKQCLATRADKRQQSQLADTEELSTIRFDERVPELYHPAASLLAPKMALWCPPLGFTSPHIFEGLSPARRTNMSYSLGPNEETLPLLSARSSRSDTLLSTKEACWAQSLRASDATGGTTTSFLRAVTPWSRLRHRPLEASSPRARREQLMARIALAGHAASTLATLDPPPIGAQSISALSPREGISSLALRRLVRTADHPAPPMVFQRPRPGLLDESLTTVELSRDWYLQQQRRRACGDLSWTVPHSPSTHRPAT